MNVVLKEYNEIIGAIESAYHDAAVKLGLSDSERNILYILQVYPEGCNQSVFYKESGLTKSTVNSAIKKMEKNGLIRIRPAAGRNTWVSPTDAGKVLMKQTVCKIIEIENEIFNSWTLEEQEMLIRLNRDYVEKFAKKIEELGD